MNSISKDLIAPCGMNCAICSLYLAHVNKLKKSQCCGCHSKSKSCSYLFSKCNGINHKANTVFCFECSQYPCKQLLRMDKRYIKNYNMSIIENLDYIKNLGIDDFMKNQLKKYNCKKCGGMISVHNGKCFHCDQITHLVEKRSGSQS